MFDHTLAASGTFVILFLLGMAYAFYRYVQASLDHARAEGEAIGHHDGEKAGRAMGYEMGVQVGLRRGVGETETKLRKEIARAYERGCADTLASLQDFEQAERGEQVARAA
jgi:hypothetical protein